MKKLLFAYHISDITLARYCSAMNVDFLIINLDSRDHDKNIELINQIQEWVEGPEIILCSDDENKLQVFHSLHGLKTLFTDQILHCEFELEINNKLSKFINFTSISKESHTLKTQIISESMEPQEISTVDTYIIKIGKEDKVGIYNFDRLDAILEKIEE